MEEPLSGVSQPVSVKSMTPNNAHARRLSVIRFINEDARARSRPNVENRSPTSVRRNNNITFLDVHLGPLPHDVRDSQAGVDGGKFDPADVL